MRRLYLLKNDTDIVIKKYIGIPFNWKGNSTITGMDCYNFVAYVYGDITGRRIKIFEHLYDNCKKHQQGHRALEKGLTEIVGETELIGEHLDLCLIGQKSREALAIVLQEKQKLYLAYQTVKQGSKVIPLPSISMIRSGFWRINREELLQ
jgi:hypothetical protein